MLESVLFLNKELKEGDSLNGYVEIMTAFLEKEINISNIKLELKILLEDDSEELILEKNISINQTLKEWSKNKIEFNCDLPVGYTDSLFLEVQLFDNEKLITKNKKNLLIQHLDIKLMLIEYINSFYGTENYTLLDYSDGKIIQRNLLSLIPEYSNKELVKVDILYLNVKDITKEEVSFILSKEYSEYTHTENNERIFKEIKGESYELKIGLHLDKEEVLKNIKTFMIENKIIEIPDYIMS